VLLEIARQTIERYHLLEGGDRVLVAVSGGPDSVALLDVLTRLAPDYGIDLHVAHLNHRLRPEADEEAEFVRALAAERGLPVTVGSADVRALAAREKLSIEHGARNARREFLLRTAESVQAVRIALGHHADDRVETVLLNIMRGAGLDGLAGMRAASLPFVRPLFDATRAHIIEHIQQRGLPYREDPSNRDPAFLRSRVRWELLPLLQDMRPGCKAAILRLSEVAARDSAWQSAQANMALSRMLVERTPRSIVLKLSSLTRELAVMQGHVLRAAVRLLLGDVMDIEQVHIDAALRLAGRGKAGARVNLPRKVIVERGYRSLIVRVGEPEPTEPVGEFVVAVPGQTEVAPLGIAISAELLARKQAPTPSGEPPNAAQFDYAGVAEPLILRTWRRGDRFQPLGMTGSMKVHDFFVNQKVPRAQRGRVPIVVSGDEIMWVAGMRIAERFKVTEATETVLRLEARALHREM
jgi:tRNA(Ile)-lysidine synthase